jgi:predicted dehydrogenase
VKTVRVGLIGAGTVVRTLHAPLLKSFGDVALSWVCDVRIETAREVADAFQIPSAHARLADCGDVDAVLLAIPVGVRDEAWRTAVARGWHVLCEKPAATTVADFDARIGACRDAKRVVTFGLMRRFYQGTLALREVLTSRLFGDPVEIWAGEGGVQQRTARGGDWYQLGRPARVRRAPRGGAGDCRQHGAVFVRGDAGGRGVQRHLRAVSPPRDLPPARPRGDAGDFGSGREAGRSIAQPADGRDHVLRSLSG